MGRTIIFTDTKRDANDMATSLESFSARALHGDIPQSQREVDFASILPNVYASTWLNTLSFGNFWKGGFSGWPF